MCVHVRQGLRSLVSVCVLLTATHARGANQRWHTSSEDFGHVEGHKLRTTILKRPLRIERVRALHLLLLRGVQKMGLGNQLRDTYAGVVRIIVEDLVVVCAANDVFYHRLDLVQLQLVQE